jgi:glucokinase
MSNNIVLGVDIGGSHITASLVDISERKLVPNSILRMEVNSGADRDTIISEWSNVINRSFGNILRSNWRIGIAMPGPVDYETGVCYIKGQHKYESLYNCNLKELLSASLHIQPDDILMINDAAGFLAGEMFIGAGKNHSKVLGLTLGTGLGSAISDNGNITDADLWHSPFLDGKAEDYISAPWLLAAAAKLKKGNYANVKDLARKARDNQELMDIFIQFGDHLGRFLAHYIDQQQPDLVILGGNVARAHHLFGKAMSDHLRMKGVDIPVEVAQIGETAALVGAAALWEGVTI